MADTTPRNNQNAVNLGLLLDDATAGADNGIRAAADGKWLTAAKKNYYLHEAYRWILTTIRDPQALQGLIATQAITFSSVGVTLNKDYMFPLSLYRVSTADSFNLTKRVSLDDDFMPSLTNFFVIEGGKIYAYVRAAGVLAALNSGSGTFFYMKADRIDSNGADVAVNTAPDTTVDRWALDACVLYAAGRACLDKSIIDSAPEWMEKGNRFMAAAMEKLPK